MRIRGNESFLRMYNQEASINTQVSETIKKLGSGLKINSASDDASGLVISEKMRSQIRGLEQAFDNIQDGISLIQTAEGGYKNIGDVLIKMREMSIKACNGAMTECDIENIQNEFNQLKLEIDRIAETTTFNGKQLLNENSGSLKYETELNTEGTTNQRAVEIGKLDLSGVTDGNILIIEHEGTEYRFEFDSNGDMKEAGSIVVDISGAKTSAEKINIIKQAITTNTSLKAIIYGSDKNEKRLQVYSAQAKDGEVISVRTYSYAEVIKTGNEENDKLTVDYRAADSESLGIRDLSLTSIQKAEEALSVIDEAINHISNQRTKLGALQNELEYSLNRTQIESQNTQASKSRITDVDMAKEMLSFAKGKILNKSVTTIMAQANQERGKILVLLRNEEN